MQSSNIDAASKIATEEYLANPVWIALTEADGNREVAARRKVIAAAQGPGERRCRWTRRTMHL